MCLPLPSTPRQGITSITLPRKAASVYIESRCSGAELASTSCYIDPPSVAFIWSPFSYSNPDLSAISILLWQHEGKMGKNCGPHKVRIAKRGTVAWLQMIPYSVCPSQHRPMSQLERSLQPSRCSPKNCTITPSHVMLLPQPMPAVAVNAHTRLVPLAQQLSYRTWWRILGL